MSDRDRVLDATDLVALIGEHVALRARGREHLGLCLFHDDSRPSMAVVTHKGTPFYKCHACGAYGNAIDFMINYHKMDFADALRALADRAGITLEPRRARADSGEASPRAKLLEANAFGAEHFRSRLADPRTGNDARAIVQDRGIDEETCEAFGIGYAPPGWDGLLNALRSRSLDPASFAAAGLLRARESGSGWYDSFRHRLIFPICDELGRPIAFGGRRVDPDEEPKYLNSPESDVFLKSKTLYALHLAKRSIIDTGVAIITEGYTDAIACHQAGIRNVVATLGTALTRDHARILQRLCEKIVVIFDGDEAGQRAADRAVEVFFAEKVDVKICTLGQGQDPADTLGRPDGPEQFQAAIDAAEDALTFMLRRFSLGLRDAGLSGRQRRLETFLRRLVELGLNEADALRRGMVVTNLAGQMGIPMNAVEAAIPRGSRRGETAPSSRPQATDDEPPIMDIDEAPADGPLNAPRAHRIAECELLGLLLAFPDLRSIADEAGTGPTPIEWLRTQPLAEGRARPVAIALVDSETSEPGLPGEHIVDRLDPAARLYGAELCHTGRSRFDEDRQGAEGEIRRLFEFVCGSRTSRPGDTTDLHKTIEAARRRRVNQAAIARVR